MNPTPIKQGRRLPLDWRLASWLVGLLACLGSLGVSWLRSKDGLSCELAGGSSYYGDPGWSWVPLGRTCTYDLTSPNLPEYTVGPSWLLTVALLGLLACGARWALRRARRPAVS